ncbi:MAG: tRNA lysidine(34) synthetase TilS [Clostridia bacterium]|nr:tRNA lysidine(34) synthetase TilS [Clostridia bacterium]
MQEKVIKAISDYAMLKDATSVTVALSGGADSVALLHCMLSLKSRYDVKVYALHLNHMLRGAESDRDEAFVTALCKKWDVPLVVAHADINKESAKTGESTELAARRVRYEFFERERKGVVATAHTASDSAETVLFNLTRGTAAAGLCGIPPVRDIYIRPLIFCTRQDIEQYCEKNGLEFVNDSTNFTDDYTRNKIRHNAVPVLKEINPSFESSVLRMSAYIREDNSYLDSVADAEYKKAVSEDGLNTENIGKLHPSIAKRVLKKYFGRELDSVNLELLYKTAKGEIGATVLPLGVTARVKNGLLCFETEQSQPDFSYKTEIYKENIKKVNSLLLKNALDCGKIVGVPVVRQRQPQDSIRLTNRGVTKTLKKLFNEMKIPENERAKLPVICDDIGVVWVCGAGAAERVRVDEKTKEVFVIKTEKILG